MVSAIRNAYTIAYSRLNGLSWRTVFTLPGTLAAITCFLLGAGAFWAVFIWLIYPYILFPMIFGCSMNGN